MDDQPKKKEAKRVSGAPEETPRRRTAFQRLLDWLIRGAERSRKDPGHCPT